MPITKPVETTELNLNLSFFVLFPQTLQKWEAGAIGVLACSRKPCLSNYPRSKFQKIYIHYRRLRLYEVYSLKFSFSEFVAAIEKEIFIKLLT